MAWQPTAVVAIPWMGWGSIPAASGMLALSLVWFGFLNPATAGAAGQQLVAESNCGKFVDVLPLGHPTNPYSGQYEEWDRWVIENATGPESEVPRLAQGGGLPSGRELLRLYVTPEGFLVPLRVYFSGLYSAQGSQIPANCPYFISAVGSMQPALRSEIVGLVARLRAGATPPIPPWLADQSPLWALVLASGEVVTMGGLGSGSGLAPGLPGASFEPEGQAFFSYSADGQLTGQTATGEEWWKLFFVGFDKKLQEFGSSTVTYQELNGFIIFQDPANISVFEVYGYRGNKVSDPSQVFNSRNHLAWIDGGNIPLVYQAQLNSKAQ